MKKLGLAILVAFGMASSALATTHCAADLLHPRTICYDLEGYLVTAKNNGEDGSHTYRLKYRPEEWREDYAAVFKFERDETEIGKLAITYRFEAGGYPGDFESYPLTLEGTLPDGTTTKVKFE